MTRPLALVSLTALSLLPLLAGCGVRSSSAQSPRKTAAEPVVAVKTVAVVTQALPRTLTLTGTLTANRESGVAADVIGKVAEMYVERGSRVRAGAPLIRLDRRQADLIEAEARSQAAAVETQAALAQSECARAEKLFADGASTRPNTTGARAQCEAAASSAHAARARRQMAGKTLGDLVIKAPFAGIVADRFVNQGEYVRAESKVATVVQLDPLRLELSRARERAERLRGRRGRGLQGGGLAGPDVHRQGALHRRHRPPGHPRPAGRGGGRQQGRAAAPGHVRGRRGDPGRGDLAGRPQGRPAHRRRGGQRSPVHRAGRPGGGTPGAHRSGGRRPGRHPDGREAPANSVVLAPRQRSATACASSSPRFTAPPRSQGDFPCNG